MAARDDENEGATRRHTREGSCPRLCSRLTWYDIDAPRIVRRRKVPHAASGHHAVAMLAAASEGGIAATFSPYAHVVSSGRTCSGGKSGVSGVWGAACV